MTTSVVSTCGVAYSICGERDKLVSRPNLNRKGKRWRSYDCLNNHSTPGCTWPSGTRLETGRNGMERPALDTSTSTPTKKNRIGRIWFSYRITRRSDFLACEVLYKRLNVAIWTVAKGTCRERPWSYVISMCGSRVTKFVQATTSIAPSSSPARLAVAQAPAATTFVTPWRRR